MRKLSEHLKHLAVFSIIAILSTIAILLFPSYWGPWVAERAVLAILPSGDNSLDIEVIGKNTLKISKIELNGLPFAPKCAGAEVRYSIPGLLNRHIESVKIQGLSVDTARQAVDKALPSTADTAISRSSQSGDPLDGWSLGDFSLVTESIDLRPILPPQLLPFITDDCLSLSISASMGETDGNAEISGKLLGSPLSGNLKYSRRTSSGKFRLSYSPPLEATATKTGDLVVESEFVIAMTNEMSFSVLGNIGFGKCNWKCDFASFAKGPSSNIKVELPNSALSNSDPLINAVLDFVTIPGIISNLGFSAKAGFKFEADIAQGRDPRWTLSGNLNDGSLNLKTAEIPIKLSGLRTAVKINGISDLWIAKSVPVAISEASISTFNLTDGYAFLRADDKSLMASEIAIGFCGGFLRLYALYFNFEKLNTGFTIVLDTLKADEFIKQFPELGDSSATGTLHGRLPLSITKDGEIRLRDGYIYSPPGEKGNISIKNPDKIISTLSSSGMPTDVCNNLGTALQNLNYDILRFDLSRPRQNNGLMKIRLKGESPNGKIATPVDLNININGPIEELLNLSVKTTKMKGK